MAVQIKITEIGVPSEKDAGIARSVITSADPATPKNPKLDVSSTTGMSSNNMPSGRRV